MAASGAVLKPVLPLVISVSSGKGGTGKTTLAVNLSIAFSRMGLRTLIVDTDTGLGNVDVALGLEPKSTLADVLRGRVDLDSAIVDGPLGTKVLAASSGDCDMTELGSREKLGLLQSFECMEEPFDVIVMDTAAGITGNVLFFNAASHVNVVVATPEPASVNDAVSMMNALFLRHRVQTFHLVVNMSHTRKEAGRTEARIKFACEKSIHSKIEYLGYVLHDDKVRKSSMLQRALLEMYPDSRAGLCYARIAAGLRAATGKHELRAGIQFFWTKAAAKSSKP